MHSCTFLWILFGIVEIIEAVFFYFYGNILQFFAYIPVTFALFFIAYLFCIVCDVIWNQSGGGEFSGYA